MMYNKEESAHSKHGDEEKGIYIGIPITENNDSKEIPKTLRLSWTCLLLSSIQIGCFVGMVSVHGFAPYDQNPFIGPPISVIDDWGSKHPYRIIHHGEYWRLLTAIFLSVGMADLTFSIIVLLCLGYHLEQRWGSWKLLTIFILSGMGGNIFGSLSSPTAVSVGSGGCIFGLLGAIHIEMICSILHARFRSEFSKQEDNEDNKQEGDDDEEILAEMRNRQETESREAYMLRSAVIVLGLLAGICATTLIELISPNHTRLEKDWSVLYGGMISGMIIGLFWHFRLSMTEDSSKVVRIMHALVILLVLFLSDRFFTSQVEHALQASNAIAKNM